MIGISLFIMKIRLHVGEGHQHGEGNPAIGLQW